MKTKKHNKIKISGEETELLDLANEQPKTLEVAKKPKVKASRKKVPFPAVAEPTELADDVKLPISKFFSSQKFDFKKNNIDRWITDGNCSVNLEKLIDTRIQHVLKENDVYTFLLTDFAKKTIQESIDRNTFYIPINFKPERDF